MASSVERHSTLAVVTGAGRGFGRALVSELVRRPCCVLAVCRSASSGLQLVPPSAVITADCSVAKDVEALGRSLTNLVGNFSNVVLVNNAGYYLKVPFLDSERDAGWRTIESNVLCAVNMVRLVAGLAKRVAIVNVVSSSGLDYSVPRSDLRRKAAYAGSKRFLSALVESLNGQVPASVKLLNLYPRNINTWSEVDEPDSLSPADLAKWIADWSFGLFGDWNLQQCVILPGT